MMSKSRMFSYTFCPKRYWFDYESGLPNQKNADMQRGIDIHQIMNLALKEVQHAMVFNKSEFLSIVKTVAADKWSVYEHPLTNFVNFESTRWDRYVPILTEQELIDVDKGIKGIIDRIDFDGDNYIVIDYKTGKSTDVKDKLIEMGLYGYLFNKCLLRNRIVTLRGTNFVVADKPVYLGIVNVDMCTESYIKLTDEMASNALNAILDVAKKISGGTFPKIKTSCFLCPWKKVCDRYEN